MFSESNNPAQIVPCDLISSLSFDSVCLRTRRTRLPCVEPVNKLVVNVYGFFTGIWNLLTRAAAAA